MSKSITIDSCSACKHAEFTGIDYVCNKKFINNVITDITTTPSWCPLPDTQEQVTNDASRYRLLRDIALLDGALAATIEIEQLDFVKEADTFDGIVDGLKQ